MVDRVLDFEDEKKMSLSGGQVIAQKDTCGRFLSHFLRIALGGHRE
jgi:hypothetical protein